MEKYWRGRDGGGRDGDGSGGGGAGLRSITFICKTVSKCTDYYIIIKFNYVKRDEFKSRGNHSRFP